MSAESIVESVVNIVKVRFEKVTRAKVWKFVEKKRVRKMDSKNLTIPMNFVLNLRA